MATDCQSIQSNITRRTGVERIATAVYSICLRPLNAHLAYGVRMLGFSLILNSNDNPGVKGAG
jgi:hypothetical protein